MNLPDYLMQLSAARSMEELWLGHTRQMARYGFDRLLYGFTRHRSGRSLGDPDDFIVLTNHAPEYLRVFIGETLYFDAPMTRWALDNDGACSWRHVQDTYALREMTAGERRVFDFNRKMDVTAGYTVSFKSISPRSKGAIALTARPGMSQDEVDAIWAEHGRDIHLMNNVAHLKILTLPHPAPNRNLTRRQREVLEWVGDGKTTQDIAILMGLTQATVEKHLRLARAALSVETTAQAVLKAALHNQIFILEA
ncbi:MAG: LuxR family transcriptional regulator [Rhodobacteraceae bacterium]|nr:LuxR family transcriptional regulator [Paracoccaceae bacterium]